MLVDHAVGLWDWHFHAGQREPATAAGESTPSMDRDLRLLRDGLP